MPSAPFVVPPLLLIAILVISAVAKLRDPGDAASVFEKLALPGFLIRLKAPTLLPYGELGVAALLLGAPGRWYLLAATLNLLLFLIYVVVVARALRFPYPITCGCFGRLGLGWITRQTLNRNIVLLTLAMITWVDSWRAAGVSSRLVDLGDGWWWLAGLTLAVAATALVVRESRPPWFERPLESDEDAYAIRPVPYALLDGPDGPGPVWRLTDTSARLLVFFNTFDSQATELFARLARWQEQLAPVDVHLVAQAEWRDLDLLYPDQGDHLLGDPDGGTRDRLGIGALPGAVILGADRFFAGGPADGLDEIEELVTAAAAEIQVSVGQLDLDSLESASESAP